VHEVLEGLTRQDLQARSGAPLAFASGCKPLVAPSLPDTD
jgi:hypothetical protein